jgi:hypothetical protein
MVGSMTWNQVSGFLIAAGAFVMLFLFDRRQKTVTPEEDERMGARSQPLSSRT